MICIAASMLAGCASNVPLNSSLTELGQSSSTVYGANGMILQRVVGINGLGPDDVPGSISRNVDQLPPWQRRVVGSLNFIATDLPDGMSPRVRPDFAKNSRLWMREFPSEMNTDITLAELSKIRQHVLELQESISDFVQANLTELRVRQDKAGEEALTKAVEGTRSARKIADQKLQDYQQVFARGGLVVANWSRSVAGSSSLKAAEDAQLGAEAESQHQADGYLIMANPSVLTLEFGKDAIELQRAFKKQYDESGGSRLLDPDRLFITHFQIRAKRIAFAETRQRATRAALNAQINQLIETFDKFDKDFIARLSALKLELNARFEAVTNTRNFGLLQAQSRSELQGFELIKGSSMFANSVPVVSFRLALATLADD